LYSSAPSGVAGDCRCGAASPMEVALLSNRKETAWKSGDENRITENNPATRDLLGAFILICSIGTPRQRRER
jgi:hypothetical protein